MKAKMNRPDGTVVELDGTPEEIRTVIYPSAKPEQHPVYQPLPTDWVKLLEEYRKAVQPMEQFRIGDPIPTGCPACDGGPWFGIYPPQHTCFLPIRTTTFGTISTGTTPGVKVSFGSDPDPIS
jgi:hypothetical protein